jgi:hypothetical protein
MTDIVISPSLPKWILDTFEGKFIAAWIGFRDHGDLIEFEGDTEDEDNEDIILLRMDADEVAAFAQLGEEAGTQICGIMEQMPQTPSSPDARA